MARQTGRCALETRPNTVDSQSHSPQQQQCADGRDMPCELSLGQSSSPPRPQRKSGCPWQALSGPPARRCHAQHTLHASSQRRSPAQHTDHSLTGSVRGSLPASLAKRIWRPCALAGSSIVTSSFCSRFFAPRPLPDTIVLATRRPWNKCLIRHRFSCVNVATGTEGPSTR